MSRIVTEEFHANSEGLTGKESTFRFPVGAIIEPVKDAEEEEGFVSFEFEGRTYTVNEQLFEDCTTEKTPIALI
jgi:hypothetical protein